MATTTKKRKNQAAVALGRKGGKNSRKNTTTERATELARAAVKARWDKAKAKDGDAGKA